jgi:hypothetical protein
MEFINENETEILSIFEQKLLLKQDVTFEGSGLSSKIKLYVFFHKDFMESFSGNIELFDND